MIRYYVLHRNRFVHEKISVNCFLAESSIFRQYSAVGSRYYMVREHGIFMVEKDTSATTFQAGYFTNLACNTLCPMPLPDARRRSRGGRNENGRWRREGGGQPRIYQGNSAEWCNNVSYATFPDRRAMVAGVSSSQILLPEMEKDGTTREEKEDEKERTEERGKGMKDAVAVWHAIRGVTPPSRAFLFLFSLSSVHPSLRPLFHGILCVVLSLSRFSPHTPTYFSFLFSATDTCNAHMYARIPHYNPSQRLSTRVSDNDMTAEGITEQRR